MCDILGEFARWKVHLTNKTHAKFQSTKTGKYIRMGRGNIIDVTGGGGPFCLFKILRNGNEIKLESDRFPGKYIAVNNNRQVISGLGGVHCRLYAFQFAQQQPKMQQQISVKKVLPFSSPYLFMANNTVILRVPQGKTIFVKNGGVLQYGGSMGKFAQFRTVMYDNGMFGFCSVVNNKFIRITPNNIVDCNGVKGGLYTKFKVHNLGNGKCKLQSCSQPNKWISCFNSKLMVGKGGNYCIFLCLRDTSNNNNNNVVIVKQEMKQQTIIQPIQPVKPVQQVNVINYSGLGIFNSQYLFAMRQTVLLKSLVTRKSLRVNPMNKLFAGALGGDGALAQWICYPLGANKFTFQNINTKKYLRIFGDVVDVKGSGGHYCHFRVLRENNTVIKLQSCSYPKKFISIANNGACKVGFGGKFCLFTCWKTAQQKVVIVQPQPQPQTIIIKNVVNMVICPKCKGQGYWGTFGACTQGSIHKKIACPCCNGTTRIQSNRQQCFQCKGMGFMGTFGACEWNSIHKKGVCMNCRGKCYIIMG